MNQQTAPNNNVKPVSGDFNLLTALIGGAVLMIRNGKEAWLFIDGEGKQINAYNARLVVSHNLVKVAGAEYPCDIYYSTTFDDFIKTSPEVETFKDDMLGTLTLEGACDDVPKEMKRNEIEYHLLFSRWKEHDKGERLRYLNKINSLLNRKQKR
jgi:hypothetical protein